MPAYEFLQEVEHTWRAGQNWFVSQTTLDISNQFMRWSILSPNYFYVVDRTIWRLNWSPPAKAFNSGMITVLLLGTGLIWPVVPVLMALYAIKVYSAIRLHRLPLPAL